MGDFLMWVSAPLTAEEVDSWFEINNMLLEKGDLFFDFCYSLEDLISTTYLGDDDGIHTDTKIIMTDIDIENHFNWCWGVNINKFESENIFFNIDGEHKSYFHSFFNEVFYKQKNPDVKNSVAQFLLEVFNRETPFTKSDLELYTEIYKLLNKNLKKRY